MNLLITCGLFYPAKLGGPANTLYWLAKGLVKEGHKVFVVCSNKEIDGASIPFDTPYDLDGINVVYCTSTKKLLKRALSAMHSCDNILLSSFCDYPEFITALMGCCKGKKIIWSPRGELAASAIAGNPKKIIYFKLIKTLLNKSITFHSTSAEETDCIRRYMGQNCKVIEIPNYLEMPSYRQRNHTTTPYFLYLGRIAPIKAIENLIESLAISKLFKQSPYVLKIVGGVEEKFHDYYTSIIDKISKYHLENKVLFVGAIHGDKKMQVYSDAHFKFLVSKSENFGNVVIESMSQGTPVVASLGTPWKGLVENGAGFWIDNNPQVIADTIDKIIRMTDEEYASYRDNALKFSETFDVYKNAYRWVEAYEKS